MRTKENETKARRRDGEALAASCGVVYPGSEYTDEESRFLAEVEKWKVRHRIKFPTHIDVLRLAKTMGYELAQAEPAVTA